MLTILTEPVQFGANDHYTQLCMTALLKPWQTGEDLYPHKL